MIGLKIFTVIFFVVLCIIYAIYSCLVWFAETAEKECAKRRERYKF